MRERQKDKAELPKSVDREQFTDVIRNLVATKPIPRKTPVKKARPAK
ncbi:MAG TPA: hypothetical protein VEX68_08300 [Bryobacteraceae bacterium]|nr:hypothetical protein [Bryobacteraceae bacterium]